MALSEKATQILQSINEKTKLGDLRKIASAIKKDHDLAMELWASGKHLPRQLAILIMDKKMLHQELINQLNQDMQQHNFEESNQLMDWLMANQLTKDKASIALILSWQNSPIALQRRTYWYYEGRLRWMGQTPESSNETLLSFLENNIASEVPEVQWAMNFTAGWIGIYDKNLRKRCIALGENTGLYKGLMVSKGCTPDYLPEFIAIESNKRNL